MNKNTVLALVAGLMGGLATRYVSPAPVLAQTTPANEIRAQHFTLVDSSDRTIGTFTEERMPGRRPLVIPYPGQPGQSLDLSPMRIVLRDSAGREMWSAAPADSSVRPLSLR